jgi:uncharacterized protein YjbI with pentapeptide repeats
VNKETLLESIELEVHAFTKAQKFLTNKLGTAHTSEEDKHNKLEEEKLIKSFFVKIARVYDSVISSAHPKVPFRWDNSGRILGDIHLKGLSFSCPFNLSELWPYPRPLLSISFDKCHFGAFYLDNLKEISCGPDYSSRLHFRECSIDYLSIKKSTIKDLNFDGGEIKATELEDANFMRGITVNGTRFDEYFSIKKCVISKNLLFSQITSQKNFFMDDCSIESFVFSNSNVHHNHSIGSDYDLVSKVFEGQNYVRSSDYSFIIKNTSIRDANFSDTKFHSSVLIENTKFLEAAKFSKAHFQNQTIFDKVVFNKSPKFHDATFFQDTGFIEVEFKDFKSRDAWRDYRTLKIAMEKFGSEHEAQEFHSYELKSRYNTLLPAWPQISHPNYIEKISSFFLSIFTDYNNNLWLPIIWLFLGAIIGFDVYYGFDAVTCSALKPGTFDPHGTWLEYVCERNFKLERSILYSLQASLWPIGIALSPEILQPKYLGIKLFHAIQLVFSTLMLFFIIFGVRRRFKI